MCLISFAPKGTKKTAESLGSFIKQGCQGGNSDGMGISWKKNGEKVVHLSKGWKDPDKLIAFIDDLDLGIDDEFLFHARNGTSGQANDVNMHPFVVSESIKDLQSIEGKFKHPTMCHNGIFSEFSDYQSAYNDTYHFVNEFMAIPEVIGMLKRDVDKFKKIHKSTIGHQKLAFLFPDRDAVLLGNFIEDGGYFHSNSGYKKYVYDKGGSSNDYGSNCSMGRNSHYNFSNDNDDDYGEMTTSELDEMRTEYWKSGQHVNFQLYRINWMKAKRSKKLNENKPTILVPNAQQSLLFQLPTTMHKSLRFDKNSINITKDNYTHFNFLCGTNKHGFEPGKLYEIVGLHGTTFASSEIRTFDECRLSFEKSNYTISLDFFKRFMPDCKGLYTKPAFNEFYEPLYTLIDRVVKNNTGNGSDILDEDGNNLLVIPSKSMLKKLSVILIRKNKLSTFKFKGIDGFYYEILLNYYDKFSTYYIDKEKAEKNVASKIILPNTNTPNSSLMTSENAFIKAGMETINSIKGALGICELEEGEDDYMVVHD